MPSSLHIPNSYVTAHICTPYHSVKAPKYDGISLSLLKYDGISLSLSFCITLVCQVGAVCHAVENVVAGKSRAAFCCVRPPGHHAGTHGLLKDCISCGFCIFNNVMAGAMHALTSHQKEVKRIAVIDLDVHHGNGTEEIIRRQALLSSKKHVLIMRIRGR